MVFLVLVLGLVIGSFLTVCVHRIPLTIEEAEAKDFVQPVGGQGRPITLTYPPRSFCIRCGNQLRWYHNIPLFSWMALRGRCAFCSERIPVRYPMTELASSLLAVFTYQVYGLTPTGLVIYVTCCALLVISLIDYDYFVIPDVISLPGTLVGIALSAINEQTRLFDLPVSPNLWVCAVGITCGAGFLWAISLFYLHVRNIHGLGLGDVKLLAWTGACFGPSCAFYTIFIGALMGSIIGLALVAFSNRNFTQELPFGPYLALATVLYIFVERPLQDIGMNIFPDLTIFLM